jgi:phosphoribosyl 1,2-cyclic phosphodiesterase
LLTDAGHVTPHMETVLGGCDALALECNHDVARLEAGRYPIALKRRILGRYGHLDNAAAALLRKKSPAAPQACGRRAFVGAKQFA